MKIAITAQDRTMDSELDPRFGRTRYFIVFDTESGEHEVVDNDQNLHAAQGAGVQAAQNVAGLGVEVVLTGNCGPKAFSVLGKAKVAVHIGVTGTVKEAVEKFTAGTLQAAAEPNVDGHW